MAESRLLPVPAAVIAHHGQTLFGPMREWLAQKRIPPVLLLTGTSGIGKRQVAWFLAQWIFCERSGFHSTPFAGEAEGGLLGGGLFGDPEPAAEPLPSGDEPGPCGKCAACLRALEGNWVDFREILPEDEGGTLKIDQFRELKGSLGFGAHDSSYRITVIPNSDRMTPQAANSLLKLLEEPPPGWLFFLSASDPTLILPTVLSRCQTLRLKPFDDAVLEKLLSTQGVQPGRAKICARLAQGSMARALTLASESAWEKRQTIFAFLKKPIENTNPLLEWAAQEPGHFNLLVDQLESLLLDLVEFSCSNAANHPWRNEDGREALEVHVRNAVRALGSTASARSFWMERAIRLAEARAEALTPMNRKLLIQDLLLPWVRI